MHDRRGADACAASGVMDRRPDAAPTPPVDRHAGRRGATSSPVDPAERKRCPGGDPPPVADRVDRVGPEVDATPPVARIQLRVRSPEPTHLPERVSPARPQAIVVDRAGCQGRRDPRVFEHSEREVEVLSCPAEVLVVSADPVPDRPIDRDHAVGDREAEHLFDLRGLKELPAASQRRGIQPGVLHRVRHVRTRPERFDQSVHPPFVDDVVVVTEGDGITSSGIDADVRA